MPFTPLYYILSAMTLQEIYELGISMAIKADPRTEVGVKKSLARLKKDYEDLPEKKKKLFDKESLTNPYADSRILYGDLKREIKKVAAGIDADTAEVLLVDRLNEKGMSIDLLITHHPNGSALAGLYEVMDMEVDFASEVAGVPVTTAYAIVKARQAMVGRKLKTVPNHGQAIDAARLLNVPIVAFHTIWDNLGYRYMQDYIAKKSFDSAGELLEYILEIPEFQHAAKEKAAPFITAGNEKSPTGKILVEFTGGTNAGKDIYPEFAKAGIGTIVQMHITEDERKEMEKYHINAIDTGHIPSDSIGANIFLDALEKRGVDVVPFAGLIRVKRTNL